MDKWELLSERLQWAIKQKLLADPARKKITQAEIAKIAEVSPTAANHWFADNNGMNAEQARKVGAFLGVNPVWLEKGEGNPRQDDVTGLLSSVNDGDVTVDEMLELFAAYRIATREDREYALKSVKTAAERELKRQAARNKSKAKAS